MVTNYRSTVGRGERVETSFLEALRHRCPHHRLILEALGELYTRAGRFGDGLMVDLELTRVCPGEAMVWYNLACSYALLARKDDAFRALSKAVELGYSDSRWMNRDTDLETLRADPRFKMLLKKIAA